MAPDSHHIKLIDFGLSRRYVPHQKLQVNFGTPEFVSPEVVNYNSVSYASDMWSVGVITYILVSGKFSIFGYLLFRKLDNLIFETIEIFGKLATHFKATLHSWVMMKTKP